MLPTAMSGVPDTGLADLDIAMLRNHWQQMWRGKFG